jgi:hypothetical protein
MIHQATSNLQLLDEQIFAERLASADERNFSGQLMRSARGDVRDHVVLPKNDHGLIRGNADIPFRGRQDRFRSVAYFESEQF